MTGLTEATQTRIRQLFPPDLHDSVADMLERECGNNLPFQESADAAALEKFHLAALTLSRGTLDGLRHAVELAKTDWRDLLVPADEAESPNPKRWWPIRRRRPRRKP